MTDEPESPEDRETWPPDDDGNADDAERWEVGSDRR